MTNEATEEAAWPIAACPYCQAALAKCPQRRTKCKACGQPIYVKIRLDTRERVLATEEQARTIEAQWTSFYQSRAFERWLEQLRLDASTFHERRAARPDLRDRDIVW